MLSVMQFQSHKSLSRKKNYENDDTRKYPNKNHLIEYPLALKASAPHSKEIAKQRAKENEKHKKKKFKKEQKLKEITITIKPQIERKNELTQQWRTTKHQNQNPQENTALTEKNERDFGVRRHPW